MTGCSIRSNGQEFTEFFALMVKQYRLWFCMMSPILHYVQRYLSLVGGILSRKSKPTAHQFLQLLSVDQALSIALSDHIL